MYPAIIILPSDVVTRFCFWFFSKLWYFHNEEEIYKALKFGADAVTYSPIFYTPDKGNPKGLEDLNEKVAKINIKIIALGGIISDEDIAKIKSTDAYAFASIRYFIK